MRIVGGVCSRLGRQAAGHDPRLTFFRDPPTRVLSGEEDFSGPARSQKR
jgi:hypothetical protein